MCSYCILTAHQATIAQARKDIQRSDRNWGSSNQASRGKARSRSGSSSPEHNVNWLSQQHEHNTRYRGAGKAGRRADSVSIRAREALTATCVDFLIHPAHRTSSVSDHIPACVVFCVVSLWFCAESDKNSPIRRAVVQLQFDLVEGGHAQNIRRATQSSPLQSNMLQRTVGEHTETNNENKQTDKTDLPFLRHSAHIHKRVRIVCAFLY